MSAETLATIAEKTRVNLEQAENAIALLRSGNTIPYIARYCKDATGGLSELKLEAIDTLNHEYTALEQRRAAVLTNIEAQGKLTPQLREAIATCLNARALEDLYLPFRRKRNTTTSMARAKGLEPFADWLMSTEAADESPEAHAATFVAVERGVEDAASAIAGARQIVTERISEDAEVRRHVRHAFQKSSELVSTCTKTSEGQKTRYNEFYAYRKKLSDVPAPHLLSMLRGAREGALHVKLEVNEQEVLEPLRKRLTEGLDAPRAAIVAECVNDAYHRHVAPIVEEETLEDASAAANESAIRLLCDSLRTLLLTPPAGAVPVLGVYPLSRSAFALAVIDASGQVVAHRARIDISDDAAGETIASLIAERKPEAFAVGNGSGFKEICTFIRGCARASDGAEPYVAMVNDSGAAQFGTSKFAQEELPDLEPAERTATTIARRFQDPLQEYVKLEPRTFQLGPNQRDVNPKRLRERMHNTMASCVNHVGVDVNAASAELLRFVAGMQYGTAQNIVAARNENGAFTDRGGLVDVPGIGAKVFEQCAGFLRIVNATNPLDATAVHPSHYAVVDRIAAATGKTVADLIGDAAALSDFREEAVVGDDAGPRVVADIVKELKRPGRDPRPRYSPPRLSAEGASLADLQVGSIVEGMVTNVTDFGAFVDVGAGQDGLVHLSEMARRFVRNPRQLVRVGETVRVKIVSIDPDKPRVSLSMKAVEEAPTRRSNRSRKDARSAERGERSSRENKRKGSQKRKRGDRSARPKSDEKRSPARQGSKEPAEPLNTQLADQLAALREKLAAEN